MTTPWKALNKPVLDRSERRLLARHCCADFKKFCRLAGPPDWDWNVKDSGHNRLAACLTNEGRGPDGIIRTHIESIRDSGKSGLMQRHAAWRICRSAVSWKSEPYKNGSIRVLYTAETLDLAEAAGKYILDLLTDSPVTKVFGSFRDHKQWAPDRFTMIYRKHPHPVPTFFVGTPLKSTQGGHPVLLYIDDVETLISTATIQKMMKTRGWFNELQAQLEPGGEQRVSGTRENENDLYGYILDQADMWNVEILHIHNSSFSHLPPEFIEGKRKTLPPQRFACHYENNPYPSKLQTFKVENFIPCEYTDKIKALPRYMLTDLAASKEDDACETALWIVALDHLGTLYCIDLIRGRFAPSETMDHMTSLFIKWSPLWFTIEKRVLTLFALPLVMAKVRETGVRMPHRVASGRSYAGKEHHILQLQPRFTEHRIVFCNTMPVDEIHFETYGKNIVAKGPLVEHFVRFPRANLKDAADALAYVDGMDVDGAPLCPLPSARATSWRPTKPPKNQWSFPKFRRDYGRR